MEMKAGAVERAGFFDGQFGFVLGRVSRPIYVNIRMVKLTYGVCNLRAGILCSMFNCPIVLLTLF